MLILILAKRCELDLSDTGLCETGVWFYSEIFDFSYCGDGWMISLGFGLIWFVLSE